ncbi:MAG TPA: protein tyrosine phosphatase [Candidatus Sumerlaeota bacterium]|nr:protein tyrosine phosphatase [Candidatus Sumerlaeota bacterium]
MTTRQKVLFVCAQNKIRSYTAEQMFAGSTVYDVRSRGISRNARIHLTEADLRWADRVFVMEKNHKDRITQDFGSVIPAKKIVVLFIEDLYQPMEPELIALLRHKLAPYLSLPETQET